MECVCTFVTDMYSVSHLHIHTLMQEISASILLVGNVQAFLWLHSFDAH